MYQPGRRTLLEARMFGDLVTCSASLLISSGTVTQPFWHKSEVIIQHPLSQLLMLVTLVCGWHFSLVMVGLYRSFRLSSPFEQAAALGKGVFLATTCTSLWLYVHVIAEGHGAVWRNGMTREALLFAFASSLLLMISRLVSQAITRALRRRGRNLRYVLIVGTNRRAIRTADALTQDRSLGYRLLGFVDDLWHEPTVPESYQSMLVGKLVDFPGLLRTLALDEVIVTLPIGSAYLAIRSILQECSLHGILVRCEASLFDMAAVLTGNADAPLQFITLHESSWSKWALSMKRCFDFSMALCTLCLMAPLLMAVAISVKLTSPGPVFFRQERLGIGKRRFRIYKFRTMVSDAEQLMATVEHLNQSRGPTFKLQNDPRITTVGSFLRKTSLDELPQLINVVLGDMSLVGPRPLPLRDYDGFSEDWHRRRFSVKPGITCLWQVMGRSSIGFERWMELDMNYIDTWSIWLDVKILLQTIPAVLRGSGAM